VVGICQFAAEVEKLAQEAMQSTGQDGTLCIAYPKGGSGVQTDVNRDRLWRALARLGWRPVRLIALDEIWSAMRFGPETLVKSRRKP
jgi:hypothetical protein